MAIQFPETQILTLPDKRDLAYAIFGSPEPTAPTVLYFHGFTSTHLEAQSLHAAAQAHGVRLVGVSRPGFGRSTFAPGRALLDWPADVLALADAVGAPRFGLCGVSGGAPYVLACVARLPRDRLLGAGVVGGLCPAALGCAGMALRGRVLLNVAPWAPGLLAWLMRRQFGQLRAEEEASLARDGTRGTALADFMDAEQTGPGRPAADVAAWTANEGGARDILIESVRGTVNADKGGEATAWEGKLVSSPWGFELAGLPAEKGRLVFWHGSADVNTPLRMTQEVVKMIGDVAELRVSEGEGHLSLVVHKADEIMATMKEMMTS